MIKYSLRAFKGLAFLFRRYNDIDIYVEDTSNRNLYEVLFQRMLEGKAKVGRVFQLGGRNAVIAACEHDQDDRERNRLYIIDGDFDLWFGNPPPNMKHLYRLSVYTSENLVLSEAAVIEVCVESLANEPRDEIRVRVAFNEFFAAVVAKLLPLFSVYAAVSALATRRRCQIHISTSGSNVTQFCDDSGSELYLSEDKLKKRIDEITEELRSTYGITQEELIATVSEMEMKIPTDIEGAWKLISGKTYLLPLLYHHIHRRAKFVGPLEQLKVRLARHCELDIDKGLMRATLEASQA